MPFLAVTVDEAMGPHAWGDSDASPCTIKTEDQGLSPSLVRASLTRPEGLSRSSKLLEPLLPRPRSPLYPLWGLAALAEGPLTYGECTNISTF